MTTLLAHSLAPRALAQGLWALAIVFAVGGIDTTVAADAMTTGTEQPGTQGTSLGTPWVTGGVGISEREAMLAAYDDYNLKLEFAVADGNYLGDIAVSITADGGSPVLSAVSTGPWLMTKLPAGDYVVSASGFEENFVENVSVPATGMQTVIFNNWTKAEVAEATPGPIY